jgi:Peptidase family M28
MSPRGRRSGDPDAAESGASERRPRRGALERPVSGRIYRAAWMAVAVPFLVTAFTVGQPQPIQGPRLEPSFDEATAVSFAQELTRRFPDRSPGSPGSAQAAAWVADTFRDVGLRPQRDEFTAELPSLGRVELVNLLAVAPGRSPETIVVMAHRDNSGIAPGANDNASGTGALLELAREVEVTQPAHTILFLSTDAGQFGGAGAARFAERPEILQRLVGGGASVIAVVNLDTIARRDPPRILFGGDAARSPSPTLVATAAAALEDEIGVAPHRPSAFAQLVDLGLPFTLHEQGPFVGRGTPAVTLTTGGERPAAPEQDTLATLRPERLGEMGRAAQALVAAIDEAAELARGTQSYVYAGSRIVRGWTLQLLLFAMLIPFFAATIDLFARCRRRHVALWPALRSFLSRLGVWLWAGIMFALLASLGAFPDGDPRPINPDSSAAGDWPVVALVALLVLSALGWLVARPRLLPRGNTSREDDLGGHLAAMLALGMIALVVAGTNPYALLFVLPSLHAWLWVAQIPRENVPLRLAVWAAGFAGPSLLVLSFAHRFGLGLDAPWYLVALTAVGYVAPPLVLAFLAWGAVASQVGALAVGRYAPYPARGERPARGPIRESIRRAVLYSRSRRRAQTAEAEVEEVEEP